MIYELQNPQTSINSSPGVHASGFVGYSTVAVNYILEPQQKKHGIPKPQSVSDIYEKFPVVQTACMTFDVDIICIAVAEKQPFHFKRPSVYGAIDRGVFFEITYAAAIRDCTMRRYTIASAISLMEVCKEKNIILFSGAERPLEIRGPYDIANWSYIPGSIQVKLNRQHLWHNVRGLVFSLSEGDAKAAVSSNCRSVFLHGETRATASGVVHTLKKPQITKEQEEECPAPKKAKTEIA